MHKGAFMKILTAGSIGGINVQAASYELSFAQTAIPDINGAFMNVCFSWQRIGCRR